MKYVRANWVLVALFAILIGGLPAATALDLRNLSERSLARQAADLNAIITGVRGFYTSDVVGRVLAGPPGHTVATDRYQHVPGAIPIPATFSLELGRIVDEHQNAIGYRFISDYPFRNREPHVFDAFEWEALQALRRNPHQELTQVTWHGLTDRVRLVAPIIMEPTCVACHNTHPDSIKRDWKVGDVRGIQELSITQPVVPSIFAFSYLLLYLAFASALAIGFIMLQRRQAGTIRRVNAQLSSVAERVSRYISPQVYERIFRGQSDGTISTKRKQLTIFFSDIKDFTSLTERLQPEELTTLLNEYFTEMAQIAFAHGGTVDKFVGDAILVFFGDPDTRGTAPDAQACLRMAVEMQRRLGYLNTKWHRAGLDVPIAVRMGINTGFCDVGNFGSADRMDYTVIGAEANLAARLEQTAAPGTIVLSYETYALVKGMVRARPLAPIRVKGIAREVVPYVVEELIELHENGHRVFSEHTGGLDLYLDVGLVSAEESRRVRELLRAAEEALERRGGGA